MTTALHRDAIICLCKFLVWCGVVWCGVVWSEVVWV